MLFNQKRYYTVTLILVFSILFTLKRFGPDVIAPTIGKLLIKIKEITEIFPRKQSCFIEPDERLRLDQVCYVSSHNAFSATQEGFVYAQQLWSIKEQLNRGVRQLLLDFHYKNSADYTSEALLCHGNYAKSRILRANIPHKTVKSALQTIKTFLDQHKDAIVSIDIENYLDIRKTYQEIKSVPGLQEYLLTPLHYDPLNKDNKGFWPTIKQLKKWGKRLIIFDDHKDGNSQEKRMYGYDSNTYLIRNMYGTLNIEAASELRKKKAPLIHDDPPIRLYQLNYFPTFSLFPRIRNQNSLNNILSVYRRFQEKGHIPHDQLINFIAIDAVHTGDVFGIANMLNQSVKMKYHRH